MQKLEWPDHTGVEVAVAKPRLLFFQWDHRPNAGLSDFLLTHTSDHVRCLETQFDVTVIREDCDFAEVCDAHEPDVCLFESGYQTSVSRRPRVANLAANKDVPRIGFHNADSWSDRRAGFLSDIALFECEAWFSICATTAAYFPPTEADLFIWPNFIDPEVFHNHGLAKVVPVMLAGQRHELYPWRAKAFPIAAEHFVTLNCPPFQYGSGLAHRSLGGTDFARAINASRFALTCGTMAREVVRKHFEIPGSGTCLVTEESLAIRQAGFRHMENCIFAAPEDVVDAIDMLLRDPDRLARITRDGYRLVHQRHTLHHRPQIRQWFNLKRQLGPGERIVQDDPFSDLRIANAGERPGVTPGPTDSLDRIHLKAGDRHLWAGETRLARDRYRLCVGYVPSLPEARFGLALCDLHEGNADSAAATLADLVSVTTAEYGAADPDPREWACFIVAVLARGEVSQAASLSAWYPDLNHPELRFLDVALARITGEVGRPRAEERDRPSLHAVPTRDLDEWLGWLASVLRTCGQDDMAGRVLAGSAPIARLTRRKGLDQLHRRLADAVRESKLGLLVPNVPLMADFHVVRRLKNNIRRSVANSSYCARLRRAWRQHRGRKESAAIRRRLS